jgi:hypothetical protein
MFGVEVYNFFGFAFEGNEKFKETDPSLPWFLEPFIRVSIMRIVPSLWCSELPIAMAE